MAYGIPQVEAFLISHGLRADISTFEESTHSSTLAAAAIGCDLGQIAKSLIFVTDGADPVLLVASGISRVDVKKLALKLGTTKVKMADAETVERLTGFPVGGVPPVAHMTPLRTLFDPALLGWSEVYAAAGTPNAVFRIKPADLQRVTGAELVEDVFRNSAQHSKALDA